MEKVADGWTEQTARFGRIHRRRRHEIALTAVIDACPPDHIGRRPAPPSSRWTQSVRQVAAGGDSGKLQAKTAAEPVAAVFGKRPAA